MFTFAFWARPSVPMVTGVLTVLQISAIAADAAPDGGFAVGGGVDVLRCDSGLECRTLGERYNVGRGVRADERLASRYFDLGCDKGDMDSCIDLAALLSIGGPTLPRDEARALRLTQKVCDTGNVRACEDVAGYYDQGSRTPGAIPQDYPKAAQIYQRVCDAGQSCACVNLAELYLHGRGVKKDRRRAAALRKQGYRGGCDPRE
jgi:TPR repeat protein